MSSVFFADKPYGITTHQTDAIRIGFIEWLSRKYKKPILAAHRLDKTTTGCLVCSDDRKKIADISQSWATINKKYLFITDRAPATSEWEISSFIEKRDDQWVSLSEPKTNATTRFFLRHHKDGYYLVEAHPLSGKTHQIRLHAAQSGVPMLGDSLYGGSPFPLLFLHCFEIKGPELQFTSSPPLIYDHLEWLQHPELCQWLMSYDRRQRLYPEFFNKNSCVRLIHDEGTPLRVDLLGDVAHAGWWSDTGPTSLQLKNIEYFFSIIGVTKWTLQDYGKKRSQLNKFIVDQAPASWQATENNLIYKFNKTVGAAPGLFLDQRTHRLWVQDYGSGKRVLNLFAYTGGFSLNAAQGGAQDVVTVDLSKKYKLWAQENFLLNQLASSSYKFYDMDSFDYLRYSQKKGLQFDLIICDPPSFSRDGKKIFRIDKDFKELLDLCLSLLPQGGRLLFSNNFESWSNADWERQINTSSLSQAYNLTHFFSYQWDFEFYPENAVLKSFLFEKK